MRSVALAVVSNPTLEFWYSPLLRMELLLQPTLCGRKEELQFYEKYFKGANCFGDLDRTFEIGWRDALKHGIPVVDALHVAAANLARCKVLFTTESPTKPIFRTKLTQVVSILNPLHKKYL
jgi:hypothetical protein